MGREQNVSLLLQEKFQQIAAGAETLAEKTRDWQMIRQFINNRIDEIKMTPRQKEKLKRYQYIYNQLSTFKYSEQEIINQVIKFFEIGLTQAYDDINATKELISTTLSINKKFDIKLELESARDLKRKCIEIGDFKNAVAAQKNIILLLREIEDEEESPADMFTGINIEATFNPELLGAPKITRKDMKELLSAINEKRKKKINIDFIEDIEFEEE